MSRFIDKRPNGRHKSALNRQRFIRRFKKQIQEAVHQAISKRQIKEIDENGENGEKITLPTKDILEPTFSYDKDGVRNIILPGNKDFLPGDLIKRASGGAPHQGGAGNASSAGELDEFSFEISKEEFLDLFFEDLALPNLIKTQLAHVPLHKMIRSGFTSQGNPANIHIVQTMRGALSRRIALTASKKEKLAALELELKKNPSPQRQAEIESEIEKLKHKIASIPFIDPFDLKYRNKIVQQLPSTQAVMFCLMDVSGSMDEAKKDIAKRFFILLYLFLTRTYERVEIVFIRHHTSAKEVEEEEFFYSRETGGTIVSSALELMKEIMVARYPTTDWNLYAAQASDGDNWNNDSPHCTDLLAKDILPFMQYFAYVEITPRHHQSLWESYLPLQAQFPHFAMQNIEDVKDIYPVFRDLFKRQDQKIP